MILPRKTETQVYWVLARGKQWYAPLLRWALKFEYNHVFVAYYDIFWKSWWGIQVDNRGVRLVPISFFLKNFSKFKAYEYIEPFDDSFARSRELIGNKYDWLALGVNILRLLLWRLTGKRWTRVSQTPRKQLCTEFMARHLQNSGVFGADILCPEITSPEMLYDFFEKNKHFREVSSKVFLEG